MRARVPSLLLLGALSAAATPARATAQSRTSQGAALPGPRVAAPPPRVQFHLPGEQAKDNTKMGSHTITISTLSLVLAVILLVVLID